MSLEGNPESPLDHHHSLNGAIMILEHHETGLRVRVVEEKDERTMVDGYGKTSTVVVSRKLVTEGGQPVRAQSHEPIPQFYLVGTRYGIVHMVRVED